MFSGNSRFTLVRELGAGGMGVVYEAMDEHRKTKVALKALPWTDADLLYRLKREFRGLRDIVHHNLVRLEELFEDSGHWFFTMELIEGEDLRTFFGRALPRQATGNEPHTRTWLAATATKEERPVRPPSPLVHLPRVVAAGTDSVALPLEVQSHKIDFERVRAVFAQIAKGLVVLHDAGKVHRDIKPSNIMVTRDHRVVILDFGLITGDWDAARSGEGEIVGTVIYMAPEQAAGQSVGPAADWYSFGVMLYEVVTGRRPFDGPVGVILAAKQLGEPRPPQVVNPQCPSDLSELCMDLLRVDPARRADGADVLGRLGVADAAERSSALLPSPLSPRTSSFIGRSAELRELERALDDVDALVTVAAFVYGESGIGKSTLIRHFVNVIEHERGDVVVMAGQCREHEAVPFKAVDGIIDALSRYICRLSDVVAAELVPQNAALLPAVFPILGRIPAIAKAPRPIHTASDPFHQRKRVFTALREMLCLLTERHRVIWVIDDMQWADNDSIRLLGELLRPPDQPRLLILASVRTGELVPVLPAIPADVRRIHLQRLNTEEATALTGMLLDHLAPGQRPQVARIVDESAGHPLFIGELVRYAATDRGASIKQLHLEEAIQARVSQLSAECVRVLEVLSMATAPLPEEIIYTATELDGPTLQRSIAVLRAGHLIRAAIPDHARLEVYHDRVRQSVMPHISDPARVALNERLAIAIEQFGGDIPPEMLVYHLEGAQQLGKAAGKALEAADRATAALAFEQAIQLYESALRLTEWTTDEQRAIRIKLGGALASAGRGPEAATVYGEAAKGADPITQLHCRIQVADQLMQSGHLETGVELLFSLFREHGHHVPGSQTQLALRVIWYRLRLALNGLTWTERDPSQIPPRDIAMLSLYKAASRGLILVDTIRAAYFVIRGLRLAMRVGDRDSFMYFLALESGFRGSERKGAHAAFVARADEIMKAHTDPKLQPIFRLLMGGRAYLSVDGKNLEAFEMLERADESLGQTTNAAWEHSAGRFFQTYSLQKMGEFPRLRTYAERYIREAGQRGNLYNRTSINRIRNILWLVDDDPAGARKDLSTDSWASTNYGYHLQHWLELNAHVEIAIYEGSPVDKEFVQKHLKGLARSFLLQVLVTRCDTAWMLGRMALAEPVVGPAQRRTARRSIAKLQACDTRYSVVLASMLRATLAIHERDVRRAVAELKTTIELGDKTDTQLITAAARRRLGALLGGEDGRLLTERAEQWMAAAGIKNFDRMTNLVSPCRAALQLTGATAAPPAAAP